MKDNSFQIDLSSGVTSALRSLGLRGEVELNPRPPASLEALQPAVHIGNMGCHVERYLLEIPQKTNKQQHRRAIGGAKHNHVESNNGESSTSNVFEEISWTDLNIKKLCDRCIRL